MSMIVLILAAVILIVLTASILFVHLYSDNADRGCFTRATCIGALFVTNLAIFLLPYDIYCVSSGSPSWTCSVDAVRTMYYVLYCFLALFVFAWIPFAYFYYEEFDGDATHPAHMQQIFSAMKYSIMLVFLMFIFVGLAFVVRLGHQPHESWLTKIIQEITKIDQVISFVIASIVFIGLIGWVTYTSFGMAHVPLAALSLIQLPRPSSNAYITTDMNNELVSLHAQLEYIRARNTAVPIANWSNEDRLALIKLEHRERQLASIQTENATRDGDLRSVHTSTFVRYTSLVLGIVLLGISCVIVVTLCITTLDKYQHSSCGFSCGFLLDHPTTIFNPLNAFLLSSATFSDRFPVDYIMFSFLIGYIMVCTLMGMARLGIRIGCIKLNSMDYRHTMQNALLMAVWFMCFILVAVNFQVFSLIPQYSMFGNQWTLPGGHGEPEPCYMSESTANSSSCVLSQLGRLYVVVLTQIPLLGTAIFLSNIAFVVAFIILVLIAICIARSRHNGAHVFALAVNPESSDDLAEYLIS